MLTFQCSNENLKTNNYNIILLNLSRKNKSEPSVKDEGSTEESQLSDEIMVTWLLRNGTEHKAQLKPRLKNTIGYKDGDGRFHCSSLD